jgi:hypothetical protein
MSPILKELLTTYFKDFDIIVIGSIITKHADANDIDILFFNLDHFKEACKRYDLKYRDWDARNGHIFRANLKVPFTLKNVQLICNLSISNPSDFPYIYMDTNAQIYNEDKPFIKDGTADSARPLKLNRKKEQVPVIALDFDGTIRSWDTNKPLEGAKDSINILRERGWKIIIHSCNSKDFIEDWLRNNDIRYDDIWTKEGKPVASVYLDDCGLKFTSWDQALKDLTDVQA